MLTIFFATLQPDLRKHIDMFAAKRVCCHQEAFLFKFNFRISSRVAAIADPFD